MRNEFRNAVKRGIERSDKNGYKWSVTPSGLRWSYCDTEFTIVEEKDTDLLSVYDHLGDRFVSVWYGDDNYADCKTLEEAYEIATIRTIERANYLY